jgi:hypothetical protein
MQRQWQRQIHQGRIHLISNWRVRQAKLEEYMIMLDHHDEF